MCVSVKIYREGREDWAGHPTPTSRLGQEQGKAACCLGKGVWGLVGAGVAEGMLDRGGMPSVAFHEMGHCSCMPQGKAPTHVGYLDWAEIATHWHKQKLVMRGMPG